MPTRFSFRAPVLVMAALVAGVVGSAHAGPPPKERRQAPAATTVPVPKAGADVDSTFEPSDWFSRMNQLKETLTGLLVELLPTDTKKHNATSVARALAHAKRLTALSRSVHRISPVAAPDQDPSLALVASLFVDETARLESAIAAGELPRARALARSVASSCIGCHTRSDRMASMKPVPSVVDLSGLHPLDRADLLMATHRFDDARVELDALLANDRYAREDSAGWKRGVMHALVLEVRTRRSPDGALALIERILNGPVPAATTWDDADAWRQSLLAWKDEKKPWPTSPKDALVDARRLVQQADAVPVKAGSRRADVLLLRATAELHDFLASNPRGVDAAEALSLLAVSYQRLRELDIWSLARLYDEACVREAPHTPLAAACFARFKDTVLAEDTGPGGVLLAPAKARLQVLEALAAPVP